MEDLVEHILKESLRSGLELTILQKAELFEIRRKLLQDRANMRYQLKELETMSPKQRKVKISVG